MARFRKIPLVIEAVQLSEANRDEVNEFLAAWVPEHANFDLDAGVTFFTTDGNKAHVEEGNWIVRGIKGELYPCRADIFAETFEPVT